MAFTAEFILKLTDRITAPWRRFTANFRDMERALKGLERATKFAANLNQAADAFDNVGKKARDAIGAPLKLTTDLEATMSKASAVTFKGVMTPENVALFKDMNKEARRLGAVTSFAATDAAAAMVELGTGGFSAKEQIASLAGTLDIAAAGGIEMAEAASTSLVAIRGWKLEAGEAGRVGDVLVNTFTSANTNLTELAEAMKYVAPVAQGAGASLEVTAAAMGELANVGIKGSQAGTVLRAMLTRLQAPDRRARDALSFLGIKTKDKAGNLKPFEDLLAEMQKRMDKRFGIGKQGAKRAALLKAMFGEEALAGAGALLGSAGAGKLQASIESNMKSTGTAARVAAEMVNNTMGATKELESAMEELQLTIGEQLLPQFTEALKEVTELARTAAKWASENPELTKTLMITAATLASIATIGGPVIRGFSMLVSGAGYLKVGLAGLSTVMSVATGALRVLTLAMITNPIGALIAAVVALVAAGWALYENWDQVKAFFINIWDSLPGPVQSALRLITAPVRMLIALVGHIIDNWDGIVDFFAGLWDSVVNLTMDAVGSLVGLAPGQMQAAADAFTVPWEGVGQFFTDLWDGIVGGIKSHIEWILQQFGIVGDAIEGFERNLPEWVTGRDRVLASGALERAMSVRASAANGGPAAEAAGLQGLASKFAGQLKITVAGEGGAQVTAIEQKTEGGGLRLDTGYQGAA